MRFLPFSFPTGMFSGASAFSQPLPWTTTSVEDMDEMFTWTTHNFDLSSWETTALTSMRLMFAQNQVFNSPLNFDTSKVVNMGGAFLNAISFNQSLADLNTQKVTDMRSLFFNATAFEETLCWELNNNLQVDDMFCGSGAGFNKSCVRLIGLVDKTLKDCDQFDDEDTEGQDESSCFWSKKQASIVAMLLLAPSIFFAQTL